MSISLKIDSNKQLNIAQLNILREQLSKQSAGFEHLHASFLAFDEELRAYIESEEYAGVTNLDELAEGMISNISCLNSTLQYKEKVWHPIEANLLTFLSENGRPEKLSITIGLPSVTIEDVKNLLINKQA
jgi:hypothetical protein